MNDNGNGKNPGDALTVLAETENFAVLVGEDFDNEVIYNIELANLTLHLFHEEWEEFTTLIKDAAANTKR